MVQTDFFVKVISSSNGSTVTAFYPQDTMEDARKLFEAIKKRFKKINGYSLNVKLEEEEGEDYFEASDCFLDFWFCVKVVEQPRQTPSYILDELECDGFFDY